MYKIITSTLVILAVSLGMVACKSTSEDDIGLTTSQSGSRLVKNVQKNPTATSLQQKIVADGAIALTIDEVTTHLSGNTQQWSNGGAYYQPDGKLDFVWEGKKFVNYSWRVKRNGLVCIQNQAGFETSCSLYFKYKDKIWTVVTEEFGEKRDFFGGPDTILEGKNLSDLEPWDPAMSGK
jgi:hypothetical protein